MQKHRSKFHTEDEDVRSQKSHYTHANKFGSVETPSKNVEVSLEVEFDDEVRSLINNPEKCPSALLDVTVVKPKGLDDYTTKTQILKGKQVKKLLNSMKLEPPDKRKLMEKLFGTGDISEFTNKEDERKSCLRKKSCLSSKSKQRFCESSLALEHGDIRRITDNSNSAVFSMYSQRRSNKNISNKNPVQQVYTTPNTHENIRAMFACKNQKRCNYDNNKKEEPCHCQNCAIVGILSDSQKKPFATEPIPSAVEEKESTIRFRKPSRKKSVSFKQTEDLAGTTSRYSAHDDCQAIFKLLYGRINELEKRMLLQEERAVPKDYFKKIITKLVTHLSKLTHYTTEDRHVGNLINPSYKEPAMPHSSKYKPPPTDKHRYYHVNPVLIDNTFKMPSDKEHDPKPCWSTGPTDSLLKWGGDVINSGRDLKNKLLQILEETLQNLKKSWEKPQSNDRRSEDDLQKIMEELSMNVEKTIKGSPRHSASRRSRDHETVKDRYRQPTLIPRLKKRHGPAVNVAYINPELQRWPEESSVSFKVETSDYDSHLENMSSKKREYKQEFLRVLRNTKKADKFKLWQTIWNQALENRQKKTDYVTIQIPDPKDSLRKKMIHLEYTIGELEHFLVNDQELKR
ncbi:uncharacterized protein LOC126734366 [Anthonomus grandis grandis]|uniref:uncharacterized protein LOC126734366 n=1 Tax=Anthonomus grandis grandis TaxID=2921223 RepID=UPI0021663C88|nr:uncharacterized protein LOC126734366 [Anthonomus grandis grandis]